MTTWNPVQYLRFGNQRLRPVLDLLSRIPLESPSAVYDLGCGTGAAALLMKERWPGAQVTGVDSSEDMLDRARAAQSDIIWQLSGLESWRPNEPADLLFSNAALHWLDDHEALFPSILEGLKPGGVLAVQMPQNFSAPTHRLIADAVRSGPWKEKLEPHIREHPVHEAEVYYGLLSPWCATVDIWETTYFHLLEGDDPVVEWTKGSILRPILERLGDGEEDKFLDYYRTRISQAYPKRPDGITVLPFKRLFMVAVK